MHIIGIQVNLNFIFLSVCEYSLSIQVVVTNSTITDLMILIYCVFNATFCNSSAISCRPVLVVEEAGVPGENHRHDQTTGKALILILFFFLFVNIHYRFVISATYSNACL
jgi:hypothetical protein